jgi:two-component sensor histidine kinase
LDFKNTDSLGLQLVNNLTQQIDGTIDMERNSGTKCIIKFYKQSKKWKQVK